MGTGVSLPVNQPRESRLDLQFSLSDTSDDENAVNVKDKVSNERYLPPVTVVCI